MFLFIIFAGFPVLLQRATVLGTMLTMLASTQPLRTRIFSVIYFAQLFFHAFPTPIFHALTQDFPCVFEISFFLRHLALIADGLQMAALVAGV